MSAQAPQVLSRKGNGVPPASAAQHNDSQKGKSASESGNSRPGKRKGSGEKKIDTSKHDGGPPRSSRTRSSNQGEKLVIRRLPPGMTETECTSILGSDWGTGNGRVDWFSFAPGKISTDPSKPSRPGRAYLRLMKKENIMPLSDAIRMATWEDAKGTSSSSSLIGPPTLEFSIYKKVPSQKKRSDARQGTIDQDPEFMAFLEELANPMPARDGPEDDFGEDVNKTETKVTTTPLVEYLKEKKSKAKEASASKKDKHGRQEAGSGKGKGSQKDDDSSKKKGKDSKGEKADKGSKETVKILTKKATTESAADAAKAAAGQGSAANNAQDAPKSRRAGIAAAARLLQRDLGLSPGSAHRRARQDAAKAEAEAKSTPGKEPAAAISERAKSPERPAESAAPNPNSRPTTPTTQNKVQSSGRRNRGGKNNDKPKAAETAQSAAANPPVILKKKGDADASAPAPETPAADPGSSTKQGQGSASAGSKGSGNKSSASQKKASSVSRDATRAFVKHVNTSQGITETSLKQALEAFGPVTSVEVDKRKGFAFVDFAGHDGLLKAINASPLTVAQGSVQVLERKDKKPTAAAAANQGGAGNQEKSSEKGSGRGRRGKGGGGSGSKAKEAGSTDQGSSPAATPAGGGGTG